MKKISGLLFVSLLIFVAVEALIAQQSEKEAVLYTVQTLFDAMAEADSAKASAVFLEGGHIFRVDTEGNIGLSTNRAFVKSIGNFEQEVVERMWDTEVLVDDNIAMAWTPYDLHVDGKFSHCGVNLVSLIKTGRGWKITDIMYNVKQENCEESPLGPLQQ